MSIRDTIRKHVLRESKELEKPGSSRRGFLGSLVKKAASAPVQAALAQHVTQQAVTKSMTPNLGVHPAKLPKSADYYRAKWGDRPTWVTGPTDEIPQEQLEKYGQAKVSDGVYTSFPHLSPVAHWRLRSVGFRTDDGDGNTLVRSGHGISFDHKSQTFTHDYEHGMGHFQTFKTGHVKDLDSYVMSDEFDDNLDKA